MRYEVRLDEGWYEVGMRETEVRLDGWCEGGLAWATEE